MRIPERLSRIPPGTKLELQVSQNIWPLVSLFCSQPHNDCSLPGLMEAYPAYLKISSLSKICCWIPCTDSKFIPPPLFTLLYRFLFLTTLLSHSQLWCLSSQLINTATLIVLHHLGKCPLSDILSEHKIQLNMTVFQQLDILYRAHPVYSWVW